MQVHSTLYLLLRYKPYVPGLYTPTANNHQHHDGFALFDPKATSNRSALNYGPKRDLLKELFDAAKTYQPHLHRGTYFSLPEWYNPDFGYDH